MRKNAKGLTIRAAAGTMPELLIYDEIGPSWYGLIGADTVMQALAGLGQVDEVCVRINSPGGDVFEGVAIYNALVRHPAKVTIAVDALAASISSVIAMAGDTIEIAANAMIMVHNAWTFAMGNAAELREICDVLDQIDATIVDTYVARTGQQAEEVRTLMGAETWMGADQAIELGFADSKTTLKTPVEASVPAGRYKNTPAPFLRDDNPQAAKQALIERLRGNGENRRAAAAIEIAASASADDTPGDATDQGSWDQVASDTLARRLHVRRRKLGL